MCQAEVVVGNLGIEQGGKVCPDIGRDVFGGGTMGPAVWVREMGPNTAYADGPGRISPHSSLKTDGTETVEDTVQKMGLPPAGGYDGGGGVKGGGNLGLPSPEYNGAIYCD